MITNFIRILRKRYIIRKIKDQVQSTDSLPPLFIPSLSRSNSPYTSTQGRWYIGRPRYTMQDALCRVSSSPS